MTEHELIWGNFDQLHVDFPESSEESLAGMERYNPMRFYRENHVFRIGHFAGKIIELSPKLELPTGSILHVLDDVLHPEDQHSDTPDADNNTFIQRETFRKFIFHVREPNLSGPITNDDKFIFRPAGLPSKLMKFRTEQGAKFKYVNLASEIPKKREALVVINHNPVFRLFVYGRMRYFRRMQIILASIFNTVNSLTSLGKQQFIQIPWGTEVFDKQLFLRSRAKLSPVTVRRPDSFHFIFMMHLVNYMWDSAVTSIFKQLPEETLAQTNLILNCGDKYLFYNLKDLQTLNPKNKAYFRFYNQLSMLSILGRVDENTTPAEKAIIAEYVQDKEAAVQEGNVTVEAGKEFEVKATAAPTESVDISEEQESDIEPEAPIANAIPDAPKVAEEEEKQAAQEIPEDTTSKKVEEVVKHLDKKIAQPKAAPAPKAIFRPIPKAEPKAKHEDNTSEAALMNKTTYNATQSRSLTKEDTAMSSRKYVSEMDAKAVDFIDKQDGLSPRQRDRLKIIAQQYKTIEIGGEPIEKILLETNDMSLEQDDIPEELVGDIPDKSALHSSIMNFDKTYVEKLHKKHLVSTLTAFQKNGVYLKSVKEEKLISEMNNTITYTCKYEDVQGKQSTVKFTLPVVDKEGRIKIDGKRQILKKQRITLPIVKISDTEISLASNYNKTRVERNVNKAHNFFSFVDSFLNNPAKSNAQIEYGSGYPNIPISYEYCSLGDHYKGVVFRHEGEEYSLCFNYNSRVEHFDGKEEDLLKLENNYGVYFGRTKKNWLFIDVTNEIHAISKYGGEDTEWTISSLIDLFKLSLKDGVTIDKALTEWVSIKILDKQLPVIFMLAYRYGLRKTLDYLGIKYTITERRAKTILGESTAGTESFAYHIGPNADLIKKYGLMSPYHLYQNQRKIFHEVVYPNYRDRARVHFKRSTITDQDIINYLDQSEKRKPLSSKCIFFSFIPAESMPHIFYGGVEYQVSIETIRKYAFSDPVIVEGFNRSQISWKEFEAKYASFEKNAEKGAQKLPTSSLKYKFIVHFAVDCNPIPASELKIMDAKPGQEGWFSPSEEQKAYYAKKAKEHDTVWKKAAGIVKNIATSKPMKNFIEPDTHETWITAESGWVREFMEGKSDIGEIYQFALAADVWSWKRAKLDAVFRGFCNKMTKALDIKGYHVLHDLADGDACNIFLKDSNYHIPGNESLRNPSPNSCKNHGAEIYGGDWIDTPTKEDGEEYIIYTEKDSQDETDLRIISTGTEDQALKFKLISFPKEEIPSLEKRDIIYTTRVSKDFDTYKKGDLVKTPWNRIFKITDRKTYTKVEDHPFYGELTDEQRDLISQYKKFAVLRLDAIEESLENFGIPVNDTYIKPSLENVRCLDQLEELGLHKNKIILGASAALVAYGIKKEPNADLDICIRGDYRDKLIEQGKLVKQEENGLLHWAFPGTDVDAGLVEYKMFTYEQIQEMGTFKLGGYEFSNIYGLFRFYRFLLENAPHEEHRQKRIKQLKMLRDAVSQWFGGKCYHGSSRQDLQFIDTYESRSYKQFGPIAFASYSPLMATICGIPWRDEDLGLSWTTQPNGIDIVFTLTFRRDFKRSEITQPFSLYELSDETFEHLCDGSIKNFGHPIVEIISKTRVPVVAEKKFDSWWDTLQMYVSEGSLIIKGREHIIEDNEVAEPLSMMANTEAPISTERRYVPKENDIAIKFMDRTLWFNRYPLKQSLIVAGLDNYDLTSYEMADFESKDIYYQLLQDKGLSTNYLKGIDSFYDLFVDGMTYMELEKMHEPTEVRDLLIRCAELLSTLDHRQASAAANHRIRGYEQFNAIVYNELSRAFAGYQARRGKANVFAVNPEAVYLRIVQNAALVPVESAGPLGDIRETTYVTHAGIGGRTSESFVVNDRKYSKDDVGIISEASVDNYKVAINVQSSLDPTISDATGALESRDYEDLKPANILSANALVFPFSVCDDSKRLLFIGTQSAHLIPVKHTDLHRIRTGYERTLAHRVGRSYAGVAEQNGKVVSIDDETKLVEVLYEDGTKDMFQYGEKYVDFEGFAATLNNDCCVKVGQKIKKGDIVTYNPNYFHQDPETKQLDYSIGTLANVALMETDTTLEDSTEISPSLSEKLAIRPANMRVITLPAKSLIHQALQIGAEVSPTTNLMVFEEEAMEGTSLTTGASEETLALLGDLNRKTPSAKFSGKVVKIEAYYGCPISEMSQSVASMVRSCIKVMNKASKMSRGTEREDDFPESRPLPEGAKYKGITFDKDTVVFIYYIQEEINHDKGDKMVFCNQLKCTCAGVFPHRIETESGLEIDALFSCVAVANRIVCAPIYYGITSRLMERIEKTALDMYFGK